MQNTILTTKEVAQYLKLNEKTVLKMAQAGELPAVKIAKQWRYYLSAIDEYMQDKITKSLGYDFSALSQKTDLLPLSRIIDPVCMNLDLRSDNRDGILLELAETAHKAKIAVSVERLLNELVKRESMLSTAVGNGMAIPHPRNPNDELFTRPGVVVGFSREGVEFASPDKKKVQLFFMTCAPDVVLHLKLLSKVAELLNTEGMPNALKAAKSVEEVQRILLQQERQSL
ncbi:MAG: PTS sugar transporter subunit IIA [Candidatus Orphnella occulta]|nr:PTS sugar transporter subunit IIA [Candidatus Orphnella occulta]MDP8297153.1 PTS sugar transporter subunit IIA [Candidatus Orphnella occulta]